MAICQERVRQLRCHVKHGNKGKTKKKQEMDQTLQPGKIRHTKLHRMTICLDQVINTKTNRNKNNKKKLQEVMSQRILTATPHDGGLLCMMLKFVSSASLLWTYRLEMRYCNRGCRICVTVRLPSMFLSSRPKLLMDRVGGVWCRIGWSRFSRPRHTTHTASGWFTTMLNLARIVVIGRLVLCLCIRYAYCLHAKNFFKRKTPKHPNSEFGSLFLLGGGFWKFAPLNAPLNAPVICAPKRAPNLRP